MENNVFNLFKNNDLIVTGNEYKLDILHSCGDNNILINIKFIDKKEFINRFYFTYDERAIYYLMKNYKLNENVSRVYLDNLYYIDDVEYKSNKLNKLVSIKRELNEEGLLIYDNLFLNYIKNKRIVFYNYNCFNKFELDMIDRLKKITEVVIIDKDYKEYKPTVYEFDSIFDEVSFVASSILKLIDSGVNPGMIKLTNIDDDYKLFINFIFPLYGIKTDINDNYLISNSIAQEFLNMKGTIKERVDMLSKKYNNKVLDDVISIVNKYIIFDNINIVNEMISNEFKCRTIKQKDYDNLIRVIDYKNYPIGDEYVFMLGFNQSVIPVQYKDEDYITDNIKDGLLLESTNYKNKIEKDITIKNILNIKNLIISYKKSTPFGVFFPSSLIKDLNLNVINNFKEDTVYSKDYARILLGKYIDNYIYYGTVTDDLVKYNSSLKIPYNTYNNKFNGIDKDKFLSSIKDGFNLSYSTINDYYNCSFKYYLSNVLRLNIYEDNFAAYIGSVFHYCLEKGLINDIEVSKLVDEYITNSERTLTMKEKFFINNLIPDIEYALFTIKDNLSKTDLKDILFEKRVEVIKHRKVTVTFKGFIDKVMYRKDSDHTIIAIVDYKTGNSDIDLKYVPFGLSMQLPIYLYLASNINEFTNPVFGGFYLQKVLSGKPVISIEKDIDKQKKENLLLKGYSNRDKDILKRFDNTYVESSVIKSMKLKKDGDFNSHSKVLDNDEISSLIKVTDKKIDEAIDSICDARFDINPKAENGKNIGCLYCDYKDICFVNKKDEINIVPDDSLSFLGGEENA